MAQVILLLSAALILNSCATGAAQTAAGAPLTVTDSNFSRAESDLYFTETVREGGFGKLYHNRDMVPIDKQTVVRMNRDTLYSAGVFDLEAAPVTITLPDPGKRFMSMEVISEDHYAIEVVYAPGRNTYTKDKVGTRYVFFAIRTLADPGNPADLKAANELQDAIKVEQANTGTFEVPNWDLKTQGEVRDELVARAAHGTGSAVMFGTRSEVDPAAHLIGTAIGWGGNPPAAAVYNSFYPKQNDGNSVYRLRLKDVPVDGFWSISVYNAKGYFEKNDLGVYSVNSLTAKASPDGSITVQFGGCTKSTPNCIPITAAWNYTVRMYRPGKAILVGSWQFPEATLVKSATHAF
jgi:para-nitrobenzyl esterase